MPAGKSGDAYAETGCIACAESGSQTKNLRSGITDSGPDLRAAFLTARNCPVNGIFIVNLRIVKSDNNGKIIIAFYFGEM